MAIHHFDLLRMITGHEAVSVFAKVGDPSFSKYDEEASAVITIEMEDGLVVSYRGSWLAGVARRHGRASGASRAKRASSSSPRAPAVRWRMRPAMS